jgi:hypothetical protein
MNYSFLKRPLDQTVEASPMVTAEISQIASLAFAVKKPFLRNFSSDKVPIQAFNIPQRGPVVKGFDRHRSLPVFDIVGTALKYELLPPNVGGPTVPLWKLMLPAFALKRKRKLVELEPEQQDSANVIAVGAQNSRMASDLAVKRVFVQPAIVNPAGCFKLEAQLKIGIFHSDNTVGFVGYDYSGLYFGLDLPLDPCLFDHKRHGIQRTLGEENFHDSFQIAQI